MISSIDKNNEKNKAHGLFINPKQANVIVAKETAKNAEAISMRTITLQNIAPTGVHREGVFKRLKNAEFKSKEKGLCFRCDERYTVGHRRKIKDQREL